MFYGCSALESLDVTGFDTSHVRHMGDMFEECASLTELDLSHMDTSSATGMGRMFRGCASLTSLDLSSFDTGCLQDAGRMFEGCGSLTSLDLSSFDISSLTSSDGMFDGCAALSELRVGVGWRMGKSGPFPEATCDSGWWSSVESSWLPRGDIVACRSGVPDTYANHELPIDISGAEVAIDESVVAYTGSALEPTVTVTLNGSTLVPNVDYSVAYANNTDVGTATVTIVGAGRYEGASTATFVIVKGAQDVEANDVTVAMGQTARVEATASEGGVLSYESSDTSVATVGDDGTVTPVSVGTATVTVTAAGTDNYNSATTTMTVTVTVPEAAGWRRLSGTGRYDTMAAIVREGFESSDWAVVACGDNFPDALAAAALAGHRDCPVILTRKEGLTQQAADELRRLGVTHAYVMGGTAAVSDEAATQVAALGVDVTRVAGGDRMATSLAALEELADAAPTTVVVATGFGYADTLSIGPWCYKEAAPILLTGRDGRLTDEQVAAVRACPSVTDVVIVGGTGVVSSDVESQLAGYGVERLGGANRYETSLLVARWEASHGMSVANAAVATGQNYPDALAGAALCGSRGSVMLLADDADRSALDSALASGGVTLGYAFGGTSAVSDATLAHCEALTGE